MNKLFKSYIGVSKIKEDLQGLYIIIKGNRYSLNQILNKSFLPVELQHRFDGVTVDGRYIVQISHNAYIDYSDHIKTYYADLCYKSVGL